ncbi:hypothetical protein CC78DRAFT_587842 [Lojkania enalia]|uniref:DUF676 domain-containing protein n=1 Tax=Lojkania enalia TaxID=147567 RepID=A0A9P4MX63_9PLEO|nr:hypothetical protein CC78DRAFT_587842 [Didymosphaeria enalia]
MHRRKSGGPQDRGPLTAANRVVRVHAGEHALLACSIHLLLLRHLVLQRDFFAPFSRWRAGASAIPSGMESPSSAPIEFEKCFSSCLQPLPSSAVDIVLVHGLHGDPMKDDEQLHNWCKATSAQERRVEYSVVIDEPNHHKNAHNFLCTKQAALDILSKLAVERERSQRTTTPIIFVAGGFGGEVVAQVLHLANRSTTEKIDGSRSILNSTYGVISLPTPRQRRFLDTLFIVASQLVCYKVLYNYEMLRPPWSTDQPTPAPFLQPLQNPSTPLFVCISFAYGISATIHYCINRTDHLQRHFVFVGVLIGIRALLPSLANPDQHPALASPLSLSITSTITLSTCLHWLWRTFFSTRKSRLDRKTAEWTQEAPEMDVESHVIRFHEIV